MSRAITREVKICEYTPDNEPKILPSRVDLIGYRAHLLKNEVGMPYAVGFHENCDHRTDSDIEMA